MYGRTSLVRWEEVADEETAAAREADLIVGLHPSCNAAISHEGRWTFLSTEPLPEDRLRLRLHRVEPGVSKGLRVYGVFPHLGRGLTSRPGIACSDGYTALLRLLWILTGGEAPYPAAIRGVSAPATFDCGVPHDHRPALHALLSGTSDRLLTALEAAVDHQEPYRRPALHRDHAGAAGFFHNGPARLRAFRLRHRLPVAPVAREVYERLLAEEVSSTIGPFWVPPMASTPDDPSGRRARRW